MFPSQRTGASENPRDSQLGALRKHARPKMKNATKRQLILNAKPCEPSTGTSADPKPSTSATKPISGGASE